MEKIIPFIPTSPRGLRDNLLGTQYAPKFDFVVRDETREEVPMTSYLGTPVYSNLILKSEGIENVVGNPNSLNPDNGATDLRLDTVLMTVEQTKNIVKTVIQGRSKGTIKEYISDGDFLVSVYGKIIFEDYMNPQQFPESELNKFYKFMGVTNEIQVASNFLKIFGITSVVVDTYKVYEIEGYRNQVEIEIKFSSDNGEDGLFDYV